MPETNIEPGTSCAINHNPPARNVTCGEAMSAGELVQASEGTYGNGVAYADADHGSANLEGMIEQIEIPAKHPQSTTPYDKTTEFSIGDPARAIEHIIGRSYWLKGSTMTIAKHAKIRCAADGLVDYIAGTTTPVVMFTWVCLKAVSSTTWVQGRFIGLSSQFTA